MATEFIKLDNTILCAIKKIKNQHRRADILHEDTIDMSIIDMIPYIQNSLPSKILDTSEYILSF